MKEPCQKCGAKRTQFEGQTSWECGSYSMYVPGLNPFWAHAESEHCKCRQRLSELENQMRPDESIADWVINELCDELECDGEEIVERVRLLSERAGTYEKAYNFLGDEHFELLRRFCTLQSGIKKILPDFNCRMFTPYHKLLKELLDEVGPTDKRA